ncbi:MAG: 2-oxoacid:ferredoxin oxidoreductase subunit beta [Mangrovibacterium sp.]
MNEFKYTAKDFKSDQEVRWCPGCGDYAIMNAIQRTMAEMNVPHEQFAVVSGIGCSSRFPYYMSTYGFHSIHGRAAAIASGVKTANPDLSVWVISGDGDSMAIGGNHFIHAVRRNVNLNLVLFNNKIYGLTKGQYSPTSERGLITKTSPFGTIESPFVPGQLVLGCGGTFFARAVDNNMVHTQEVLKIAAEHHGASIVEVLQNCVIFSDGVHEEIANAKVRKERQVFLEHGKPMLFGNDLEKGIVMKKGKLQVVTLGEDGYTLDDVLIHDAHEEDPTLHLALVNMKYPDFPVAMGVIRDVKALVYDEEMQKQIAEVQSKRKLESLEAIFYSGNTWEVNDEMSSEPIPFFKKIGLMK